MDYYSAIDTIMLDIDKSIEPIQIVLQKGDDSRRLKFRLHHSGTPITDFTSETDIPRLYFTHRTSARTSSYFSCLIKDGAIVFDTDSETQTGASKIADFAGIHDCYISVTAMRSSDKTVKSPKFEILVTDL